MTTPPWNPAVASVAASAGQVDQFLGTHDVQYVYEGVKVGGTTAASASQGVYPAFAYIDQKFVMSGTRNNRFYMRTPAPGGAGAPLIVQLYSDSGGNPNTLLQTVLLPMEWSIANSYLSWPLLRNATNGTTYHWVFTSPTANGTDYPAVGMAASVGFVARHATSLGGPWTNFTGSVSIAWYDGTVVGRVANTWEDSGARVTGVNYNADGTIAQVYEATDIANAPPNSTSLRQVASTGGVLTGVT